LKNIAPVGVVEKYISGAGVEMSTPNARTIKCTMDGNLRLDISFYNELLGIRKESRKLNMPH
jgi:hypothetical protein